MIKEDHKLTIALPKGRLFEQTIELFKNSDILPTDINLSQNSRKLVLETDEFKFLIVRGKDVSTYVEYGIADIGIVGDDILLEQMPNVYKPVDLKIGACKIVVAGKGENESIYKSNPTFIKVATKYPNITKDFFSKKGIKTQIIELYGSVELAPLVKLSDFIVDIVETGKTLKENGLIVIEEIRPSTAKLVVNRIVYKTKNDKILNIIQKLENYINNLQ